MRIGPLRPVNPEAIVAPPGYRVEALISGLTFPSAISFGPGGEIYLAECGGPPVGGAGQVVAAPRVLRFDPDLSVTEIGRLDNPIVGLVYRSGELLIGEDGPAPRILRVTAEGEVKILAEGLPGGGDYGLSGLSLDATGALLFGLGSRTNSGVIGADNVSRGWPTEHPEWADVPGADVELEGANYVTSAASTGGTPRTITGSFKPFGRRSNAGEVIRGTQRCGGAVYRVPLDGGEPERVAWGFRNPIGLALGPDGRLFLSEGGMEERGSRPIAGAPDCLWEVRPGGYYGWPDHAGGVPVEDARFRLPGHPRPRKLISNAPQPTGLPQATFAPRSGIGRFDFSCSEAFGHAGDAFVALSGEWCAAAYASEDNAAGACRIVRVDPRTGQTTDFLVNRSGASSSSGNGGGLERPFDVRFDPTGEVMYVVDLGEIILNREFGLEPFGATGVVWRISRIRSTVSIPSAEASATLPDDDADEDGDEESEDEAGEGSEDEESDADPVSDEAMPDQEAAPTAEATAPDERIAAASTQSDASDGSDTSDEAAPEGPDAPEDGEPDAPEPAPTAEPDAPTPEAPAPAEASEDEARDPEEPPTEAVNAGTPDGTEAAEAVPAWEAPKPQEG